MAFSICMWLGIQISCSNLGRIGYYLAIVVEHTQFFLVFCCRHYYEKNMINKSVFLTH